MKNIISKLKVSPLRLFILPPTGYSTISIIKTFYYNFRCLPFKQAIHFPIWLFKNVKVKRMGKIIINGVISNGMIRFGEGISMAYSSLKIMNSGKLIINGRFELGGGSIIYNQGTIVIEGETRMAHNNKFFIQNKIIFGKYFFCGWDCMFQDSDFHYSVQLTTGEIKNCQKDVYIGKCCWIGSGSTILKGVFLPDYTIVSSNSLLNKNYSEIIPVYSIIGGVPAKVLSSGYRRIFNKIEERKILNFFRENKDFTSTRIDVNNIDLEKYLTENAIR
jgi:acetyltransferase-like isoleucine patch superfamily enzyme